MNIEAANKIVELAVRQVKEISKCEVVSIHGELSLSSYKPKSAREFNSSRIIRDLCWKVVLNRMGQVDHFVTRSGIVIKR